MLAHRPRLRRRSTASGRCSLRRGVRRHVQPAAAATSASSCRRSRRCSPSGLGAGERARRSSRATTSAGALARRARRAGQRRAGRHRRQLGLRRARRPARRLRGYALVALAAGGALPQARRRGTTPRHRAPARRSRRRAASCSGSPRCSASTPSAAASSCSRCWRSGCTSASTSRSSWPARSSSSPDCSRRVSQLASSWLAARIGLVRDDGLHAPAGERSSSIAAAFTPSAPLAVAVPAAAHRALADGRAGAPGAT